MSKQGSPASGIASSLSFIAAGAVAGVVTERLLSSWRWGAVVFTVSALIAWACFYHADYSRDYSPVPYGWLGPYLLSGAALPFIAAFVTQWFWLLTLPALMALVSLKLYLRARREKRG